MTKLQVGVSHCLLGANVRYNGKTKRHSLVSGVLGETFQWVPVCPEVEVGLSVPRPPIELVATKAGIRACGVSDRELDPTDALKRLATTVAERYPHLSGFVFKARSPSCGLAVDVFAPDGEALGTQSAGVFAGQWMQSHAGMPVIDEEALGDRMRRERFIEQVRAYRLRLREQR